MKNSLYDLYLISREFPNRIFDTQELLNIFGYSDKTSVKAGCKMLYFVGRYIYKAPKWFWKVRDVVAIKSSLINIKYDAPFIPGPNREALRLIPRDQAPFYLLKEYGGTVI